MALRVFRQRPNSCRTELAVPLAPLDPAAMVATIKNLGVRQSVNTPLAAAIEAVAGDLVLATGPRIVVVLSDGEESCGGDPAAAVRALRGQGVDISVNIVGLGLDRKVRRQFERLAEVGGGSYFDARDADELSIALHAALGAPFVVRDVSGRMVGRGTVDGAAVELPPGAYRVTLLGGTQQTLGVVVIESGSQEIVVVPASSSGPTAP